MRESSVFFSMKYEDCQFDYTSVENQVSGTFFPNVCRCRKLSDHFFLRKKRFSVQFVYFLDCRSGSFSQKISFSKSDLVCQGHLEVLKILEMLVSDRLW